MTKKEIDFAKIYQEIEEAVQILEAGGKSINENIKIYQEARAKIKVAQKALQEAENKIKEITLEK